MTIVDEWAKSFPWESDVQREGFWHFWKWKKDLNLGTSFTSDIGAVIAFFVQKDHESNEWWLGVVQMLEDRIAKLELAHGSERYSGPCDVGRGRGDHGKLGGEDATQVVDAAP